MQYGGQQPSTIAQASTPVLTTHPLRRGRDQKVQCHGPCLGLAEACGPASTSEKSSDEGNVSRPLCCRCTVRIAFTLRLHIAGTMHLLGVVLMALTVVGSIATNDGDVRNILHDAATDFARSIGTSLASDVWVGGGYCFVPADCDTDAKTFPGTSSCVRRVALIFSDRPSAEQHLTGGCRLEWPNRPVPGLADSHCADWRPNFQDCGIGSRRSVEHRWQPLHWTSHPH